MASRPFLRRRAFHTSVALLAAVPIFLPTTHLHAEALDSSKPLACSHRSLLPKKPIYDDLSAPSPLAPKRKPDPADDDDSSPPYSPTPTDRLAGQIRRARLFLHAHTATAEDRVNDMMTSFLDLETSFTSTVASLAPPKESGEKLLPGVIYVLVSAMAGSIVTRNRGLLLRTTVPVAIGIGASWALLPLTTRNVADLAWQYEQKVPVISNNHLRIRGFTEEGWRIVKSRSQGAYEAAGGTLQGGRRVVEDWVKEGK